MMRMIPTRSTLILGLLSLALGATACGKKEAARTPSGPAELRSGDKAADKAADEKIAAEEAAAAAAAAEAATGNAAPAAAVTLTAAEGALPTARHLLLAKGNVFGFSLEDSSQQLAAITAGCAAEAGADSDKLQACLDKAKTEGAKEGFRFESAEADRWTWISYGQGDDGTDEIFIKAVVELQESPADRVIVKVVGEVSGKQWDAMPVKVRAAMMEVAIPILVVDEDTVAMDSPRKGRLIYHLRK